MDAAAAVQDTASAIREQTNVMQALTNALLQQTHALTEALKESEKVTFERDNQGRITAATKRHQ
jgi:hypothetical protein